MVNIEDFIKRLELILEYYNLNASSFADKIGVQRSSMSHLLSGRNKPSLDFILKIIEVFPEVDLYWILNGKGEFPKVETSIENKIENIKETSVSTSTLSFPKMDNLFSEMKEIATETKTEEIISTLNKSETVSEIEKIVFFYKNGTFKIYEP